MKTLALFLLLSTAQAQDCVDIWQFFDGFDWVSVEKEQVEIHYGCSISFPCIKTDNATYYNVPVRKLRVCNQKQKEQANERN